MTLREGRELETLYMGKQNSWVNLQLLPRRDGSHEPCSGLVYGGRILIGRRERLHDGLMPQSSPTQALVTVRPTVMTRIYSRVAFCLLRKSGVHNASFPRSN